MVVIGENARYIQNETEVKVREKRKKSRDRWRCEEREKGLGMLITNNRISTMACNHVHTHNKMYLYVTVENIALVGITT